jgi:hypothetical protein
LADALLFDSDAKSELVEFLLHPVPHTGTRRRLFPCGVISQVRFSRLISPPAPGAELELRASYSLVDVSICRSFLRIDNRKSIAEMARFLKAFKSL